MTLDVGPVLFAAAGLAISHGLSFWWNFLRGGEYRRTTAGALMFAPYGRLVVLHITIIFGAFAVMLTGAPAAAVAVLVAIKTAIDLGPPPRRASRLSSRHGASSTNVRRHPAAFDGSSITAAVWRSRQAESRSASPTS